jgi:hypothetical protein
MASTLRPERGSVGVLRRMAVSPPTSSVVSGPSPAVAQRGRGAPALRRARPADLAYHDELGRLEESDDVAIRVPHGGNESALADVFWILDGLSAGIQE